MRRRSSCVSGVERLRFSRRPGGWALYEFSTGSKSLFDVVVISALFFADLYSLHDRFSPSRSICASLAPSPSLTFAANTWPPSINNRNMDIYIHSSPTYRRMPAANGTRLYAQYDDPAQRDTISAWGFRLPVQPRGTHSGAVSTYRCAVSTITS